jgi:hypothetical protein
MDERRGEDREGERWQMDLDIIARAEINIFSPSPSPSLYLYLSFTARVDAYSTHTGSEYTHNTQQCSE